MKYIIKTYDYNTGDFYGYAAPHPDDSENKCYSYYVNEVKDAKRFASEIDANNYIERFQDGSGLCYITVPIDD